MSILYYYSKFFKKIIRGKAIKNSIVDKTCKVGSGSQVVNSKIDKFSYCGYDCEILNAHIGKFTSIANNVYIGGAEHPIDWVSMSPVFQNIKNSGSKIRFSLLELPKSKTTIIGSDVWIGHGVSIKQGVKIGDGAVIGTGSIVTKDVEAYSIVAGCPAKIIKYRFSREIIEKLLDSKWWNLDEKILFEISKYIKEPETFIKAIKSSSYVNIQK